MKRMNKWQRFTLTQALIIVGSQFSLCYGWGLRVNSWPIVLAYTALVSVGLPALNVWVNHGRDGKKEA